MTERRWKLDPGLQDLLLPSIERLLETQVGKIKAEIEAGEISEQSRRILVEWRWITPRDGRLTLQEAASPSRKPQDASRPA